MPPQTNSNSSPMQPPIGTPHIGPTIKKSRSMNPLLIPVVVLLVLTLALAGFGFWAYVNYVDHKNNVQEKVEAAVKESNDALQKKLENEFLEKEKEPYKVYESPGELGSVRITYPKTWSAFMDEKIRGTVALDGYLHPGTVKSDNSGLKYALRVEILNREYSKEVSDYQKKADKGEVKASNIQVSGVAGVRFDGTIEKDVQGAIILIPTRDKVLKVWTESTEYLSDYNEVILKNLSFTP